MSESTAGHASAVAAAPAPAGRAATATPACVTFTPQSLFYAPPSLDIEAAAAPARATPVAIDADLVARIRRCFVDTAHASAAESSVVQADPSRRSLEAARFFFLHAQSAVLSRQASPRPPNDAAVAALAATSDAVVLRPSMRFFLSEATGDGDDGNGGRDGEVAVCHASAGPHGVVTYRIERET
ncbi:hypothetical protein CAUPRSCDRAFT_11036 [Caulochytrium protostelioides]|uniref:Uncharacterized protein n=1 Tax=Caulochytrium protostelioides TaxID=1555241 RepID=A0A4P9WVE3_9FUNG|nr:hypothetical protein CAUPRSCDRAFT_11036 [Caulochytrium protostelioides]